MARELDAAIQPLREKGEGRSVGIMYFKPEDSSTAVKIEFKRILGRNYGGEVARLLADETPGPHVQEPFCQFVADTWAKSVGLAVQAALAGVRLDLIDQGGDYIEYLVRSYRTLGT